MKRIGFSLIALTAVVGVGLTAAFHHSPAHADTPTIDLDKMCGHSDIVCQAAPDRDAALATVRDQLTIMAGGTLPSRIDVTEESIDAVNQVLGDKVLLPVGRKVWYIRTYAPVTLTAQTAFMPRGVNSLTKAHGAAFVIDVQTGLIVATAAFN